MRHLIHWKTSHIYKNRQSVNEQVKTEGTDDIIFDINFVIINELVTVGQNFNKKGSLYQTEERVRKKLPDSWKNYSWILYQINVTVHNALSVKQYLVVELLKWVS